jgi:hypothetical protein
LFNRVAVDQPLWCLVLGRRKRGRETSSPSLGIFPKKLEKRKVGVNFPSKMPFPVKAFNIRDLTYGVTQQYKYKRKKERKKEQKQNQKQFFGVLPWTQY